MIVIANCSLKNGGRSTIGLHYHVSIEVPNSFDFLNSFL